MNIRQLEPADLPRITEIARHGMEFDEITEPLIAEKTVDAPDRVAELGLVAEHDGRVVGFAQGALGAGDANKGRGYVRLLVVDPAHRCRGIGSELIRALEDHLREKGVWTITVMDCPQNYLMPGVDFRYTEAYCFLYKHGYQKTHENHNLLCEIGTDLWPDLDAQIAANAADGIEVRRARRGDEEAIHTFIEAHWPGWHPEADGAYRNDPVSLHVAFRGAECVAFAGYQGNNRALNWFGPMGTLPGLRGKGIGGLMLRLCLRDLARQGWRTAIIPWVGPTRFYARYSGARMDRCFWAYKKEL